MLLSVFERFALLNILPMQGNVATLKIVRQLREDLSFGEDEHKLLEIESIDGGTKWNRTKEENKEVEIGPKALEIIRESYKKLDEKEEVSIEQLDVYTRFMEDAPV